MIKAVHGRILVLTGEYSWRLPEHTDMKLRGCLQNC